MFDNVREVLERPGIWFVLTFYLVLALGAWRIGLNGVTLLASRLSRHVHRMLAVAWTVLVFYSLAAILAHTLQADVVGLSEPGALITQWFREAAGRIITVLVMAALAWSLVGALSAQIVPSTEFTRTTVRVQTLKGVVESFSRVTIIVIAVVMIMQNVGIHATTLLAGVSVLGLAVSFGAQSLIKDVINGFFILLEDQYGVGDVITVNGGPLTGGVERMNLRFTALRALDGTMHIIPNGQINTVSVMSKDWSRVVALVNLPLTADPNIAIDTLRRVSEELYADPEWARRFIDPPNVEGVSMLSKDGFEVRALFKVLPKEQWPVGREFNRRMKIALDEVGLGGLRPQLMIVQSPRGGAQSEEQRPVTPLTPETT